MADRISRELERSLESCLQQRSELKELFDASSLDLEIATLQCQSTMHFLQFAAQSSSESISLPQEQSQVIQQHMERLMTERKRMTVNHHSSTLMERHHRVLSKLLLTVAAMTNIMSSSREKLVQAMEMRNDRIEEQEDTISNLRNHIKEAQNEMAGMAEAQTQALMEKGVLKETVGQLRNQLSLVEAQASEALNVSLTQNEREQQTVVRLEATIANLREEPNSNVLEMERWTMQQRLDTHQRNDLSKAIEELEKEKATWKHAATTSANENDVLTTALSKTKYELDYQSQTLSQQINDYKSNDLRQRGKIEELQQEIRGLKDDLKSALETIEREKHIRSAHGGTNSELMELRERVAYVRGKQELAESKVKTQRDEMEDLIRAHRTQITEQDDVIRRLKVKLVDAQNQEARLLPMQKKVDDLTFQLFEVNQESKSLAMEVGNLKAENARHVLRQLQRDEADKEREVTPISMDENVKMNEEMISQLQIENERLRNELTSSIRDRDAANANLQCMEGRKDFLTRTLEEVQDQVTKLSGQVQRERSLGNTTEQRIHEIRALVPHWRWEEKQRTDRTLALSSSPTNSNTSIRSLNSSNILPR